MSKCSVIKCGAFLILRLISLARTSLIGCRKVGKNKITCKYNMQTRGDCFGRKYSLQI